MTRLYNLVDDFRALGREPVAVDLSREDEATLRRAAAHTFGDGAEAAALGSDDDWRAFLRARMRNVAGLAIEFDAIETRVS